MRHDYSFGAQLGRGSFGVVFRVRRKSDGCALVCKQIELSRMGRKHREEARREVAVLERVSSGSQYIVQYHGSFLEDEVLHIIMEFCEHGDLSRFVKGRMGKLIEEPTIWKFLIQIGLGLRWLHRNRILHRDIKTLNVFLTSADNVRLGDLGVARVLSQNTQFADTFVGTPYYLSPELCEEKPYNELSDVWAYGCVVYEMSTLKHPFDAKNQAALLVKILRGKYAPISDSYSGDLKALIDICMKHDYMKRKKLADLLSTTAVKSWAEGLSLALDGDGGRGAASQAPPQQPRRSLVHAKTAGTGGFKAGAGGGSAAAPGRPAPPRAIVRAVENRGPQLDRMPKPSAPKQASERCLAHPPEGLRVRERRPCERRGPGGRRSLVKEKGAAPSNTIVAPVSRVAAIHNVPLQRNASRPHAGSPVVSTPRRVRDSAAERRRAAREVADLPDTVVPQTRPTRNAPSVHQLMQLDPEPVVRPVSQSSSAGGSSVVDRTNWAPKDTSPKEVLAAELALAEHEATLLPEEATQLPLEAESEVEEHVEAEGTEEDQEQEAAQEEAEEIPTEQELAQESEDEPSHEELSCATGQLQPLHAEVTCYSAFGSVLGEDTLAYSIEDTLASKSCTRRSKTEPCPVIDAEKPSSDGFDRDDACCIDGTQDESLQAAAEINGNGLLCDAPWMGMAGPLECHWTVNASTMEDVMADDAAIAGSTEERSASARPAHAVDTAAGADAHCPGASSSVCADAEDVIVALEDDATQKNVIATIEEPAPQVSLATMQPVSPVARPPAAQVICEVRPKVDRAAKEVARLNAQVLRLHADVARNLDPAGLAVWDELCQLFRAKVSEDLTDEDQSEIERFVFEKLPTESTDLIFKVYKVLHLEQERDRYQQLVAAS